MGWTLCALRCKQFKNPEYPYWNYEKFDIPNEFLFVKTFVKLIKE